jgi:DNA-binding transcriptional regulator YiaG
LATRAAAERFMATHYRRFSGQEVCPAPLPTVPNNYDQQLRALRRRLGLTQDGLARRIGAAGKAVIYQWESRKRTPSPVLWQQVMRLQLVEARTAEASAAGPRSSRGKGRTPSQDSCGGGIHTELRPQVTDVAVGRSTPRVLQ